MCDKMDEWSRYWAIVFNRKKNTTLIPFTEISKKTKLAHGVTARRGRSLLNDRVHREGKVSYCPTECTYAPYPDLVQQYILF